MPRGTTGQGVTRFNSRPGDRVYAQHDTKQITHLLSAAKGDTHRNGLDVVSTTVRLLTEMEFSPSLFEFVLQRLIDIVLPGGIVWTTSEDSDNIGACMVKDHNADPTQVRFMYEVLKTSTYLPSHRTYRKFRLRKSSLVFASRSSLQGCLKTAVKASFVVFVSSMLRDIGLMRAAQGGGGQAVDEDSDRDGDDSSSLESRACATCLKDAPFMMRFMSASPSTSPSRFRFSARFECLCLLRWKDFFEREPSKTWSGERDRSADRRRLVLD